MSLAEELARLAPPGETCLTIGVFDGVHLGHQRLVQRLRSLAQARGLLSGVITFHQHPLAVLAPQDHPTYLTSLEERLDLLRGLGVDFITTLTFTPEMARLGAREFLLLLREHLKLRGLVIGPDFTLGRGREGDEGTLRALGREMGFAVEAVPPVRLGGQVVSSTAIRQALGQGDMPTARRLLGRPFSLGGPVVRGAERGHLLGYPTANLSVDHRHTLPPDGVYAARAILAGRANPAAAYIGRRPTFGEKERTVEVFLLDFQGDLYGQGLRVEFLERVRPDMAFPSTQELKAQIERDVAHIRGVLAQEGGST